jgi:hypothetical protein
MTTGRSQPSIVIDVQVLLTHPASVATMEREMGHPPRLIRAPDVCYLFQTRDAERLPGLVDRWASYGIAAQVVLIPPRGGRRPAPVIPHHHPATNRQAVTLAHRQPGSSARPVHAWRDQPQERPYEFDHRPRPRGTRPDRTIPDRGTGARGDHGCPARDGGLL